LPAGPRPLRGASVPPAESPLFVRHKAATCNDVVPATEIARLDVTYRKDCHRREVVEKPKEDARDLGGDVVRIGKDESGLSRRNFAAFAYRSRLE